ncbi:MAG: hypothetical protein Fur0010_01140 [Bdellovibrio sp.]
MKTMLVALGFFAAVNIFAEGLPLKLTQVQPEYLCQNNSGGIAFSLPSQTARARVWQVDPGEKSGVEILIKSFEVHKCSGCFSFEGQLSEQILVYGDIVNYQLTYKISDLETGTDFIALEAKCHKVQ